MKTTMQTTVLSTGTLTVEVRASTWALDDLCAFAARDNPKRAFLVVSKILGRHVPTRPSVMRASFADLAALIPADLPGPIILIGLAETAICLGQGVHEEFLKRTQRDDILFMHSTRQKLDHPILCEFEEPHSHASSHIIYRSGEMDGDFAAPRSLIIVDDEISTGTTITNLARAVIDSCPSLQSVVAVTLTDWSLAKDWMSQVPRPCKTVSLLAGTLHCEPNSTTAPSQPRISPSALGTMAAHRNFGRLGRRDVADEGDGLVANLTLDPKSAIRVLGTGEFTFPSFRIGEVLEAQGHDVVMQSTTRSPVQLNEIIASKLTFKDNYGTDVPNFVYNVDPSDDRVSVLCHETPKGSIDPELVSLLNAHTLCFDGLG